jgi:hypothetical protein
MATTTNYGWTTPDNTALVKDGASAIRTLGSSIDTSVKSLSPGTTAGDLDYYTSTTAKARLGIGSTGQVLTVAAGVPSWATSSSGGMTLLSTTTLSGTTTTVSSINQTYTDLEIVIVNATAGATYKPRLLPNGSQNLACVTVLGATNPAVSTQLDALGITNFNTTGANAITLSIKNYASTSQYKTVISYGSSNNDSACSFILAGFINTTSAITSIGYTTIGGVTFTGGTMLIYGVK